VGKVFKFSTVRNNRKVGEIMLYDTHTHLNAEVYNEKIKEILDDANEQGVSFMNVVGFDRETNKRANELAKLYPNLYASAGLHPVDAHLFDEEDWILVENYLKEEETVAVGECGLDYYWQKDTKDIQKEVFRKQIELSKAYQKPLIIHTRDAIQDTYEILKEASLDGLLRGVMHSYSGSVEMAKRFLDLGLYISLAGPVTFKNAKEPKEVAKMVPLNRLLIETDCPYLTPHPFRGKENKPGHVRLVAESIASLREDSLDTIAKATTENAKRLFQIKE
jgi:TatD DNase family protein